MIILGLLMYLTGVITEKDMGFSRLKPAVSRNWLLATAGLTWTVVGIILCLMAIHWLATFVLKLSIPLGVAGLLLAIVIFYFGFSKVARKNIERLFRFQDKVCFFAFQAWKSYLIIAVMAAIGAFLRHSPIPKQYLAVIYLAIGGALLLSSFIYYVSLLRRRIHSPY